MLWEIAKSLAASSPVATALDQARRMAGRHLEHGGAAASGRDADPAPQRDFPLPLDIHAAELATAIDEKLRRGPLRSSQSGGALDAIDIADDGHLVFPAAFVVRVGAGEFERGRRFLERVLSDIRGRRAVMRARNGT
jgi:hypothetical protein